MMTRKLAVLVAAFGIVFGMSVGSAYADPVTLDLNRAALGCTIGTCTPTQIDAIDLKPGNALAVSALPITPLTPFQLYFQAALNSFLLNNIGQYSPDFNTVNSEVTAVAGFREQVTSGTLTNANFSFVSGGNNFFNLYYDSSRDANDLAGTGFNDGTPVGANAAGLILGGTIVSGTGTFQSSGGTSLFDQHGVDNYAGEQSINGNGSTRISIVVNYLNPTVFTNAATLLAQGLVLSLTFDTTNSVPFISVDPSVNFWNGTSLFAHNIGAVNGSSGPDFQFQTDANGSFAIQSTAVPEPATLTLLGLGLFGSAAARRRQLKKKIGQ